MPTNTKESALEDLIANSLVQDNGYEQGNNEDYNRNYAIDETRLFAKRGVIDILRNGVKFYPSNFTFFYPTPSERNEQAKKDFEKNIWSLTRQLRYSNDETRRALDLVVFINGLPIFTIELKNRWTQ